MLLLKMCEADTTTVEAITTMLTSMEETSVIVQLLPPEVMRKVFPVLFR